MEQLNVYNKIIKILSNWIESHKNEHPETLDEIIEVFKDFYGEDNVDVVDIEKDILLDIRNSLDSVLLYSIHDPDITLIDEKNDYTLLDFLTSDRYPDFLKMKMFRKYYYHIKDNLIKYPKQTEVTIHIPEKEVTNEEGESTIIYDVYVRFYIDKYVQYHYPKVSNLKVARSTYTENEIKTGYIHSHVPKSRDIIDFSKFHKPCLGSGPLGTTISYIYTGEYNIKIWNLFALELNLFLGTESLTGGPYIRLSTLKGGNKKFLFPLYENDKLSGISKKFKNMIATVLPEILNRDNLIGFNGCNYFLTESLEDFIININKEIAKKFSEDNEYKKLSIKEYKLNDKGELILIENKLNQIAIDEIENLTSDFKFKDERIPIKVINSENDDTKIKTYKIIDCPKIYMYLYKSIINAINIKNINHE
jgi:hypothetical protein